MASDKIVVSKGKVTAVANAIREKAGTTEEYTLDQMPTAIAVIQTGGGEDFYIDNASYLFYFGARLNSLYELLGKLKNVTNMNSMFYACSGLTSLDLSGVDTSKVTDMRDMFCNCSSLTSLDFSGVDTSCVTKTDKMFLSCCKLNKIILPNISRLGSRMFQYIGCNLTNGCTVDLGGTFTSISSDVFSGSSSLITSISSLIIRCNHVVTLASESAFNYCWIKTSQSKGFIYVPDDLVDSYKEATNWTTFASKIKPLSEYVEV